MAAIRVAPSGAGFGAEITGLDISQALPAETLAEVKAAFAKRGVVWFPGQPLDHDQLEAFTLQFGDFGDDPYIAPLADRPHILEVRREPDETASVFGSAWHSDWSFQEAPPAATILHAKEVPPVGGDTLYADTAAAYRALGADARARLEGLRAVHSAARPYGASGFYAAEKGRKGMKILPSAQADKTFVHPLVRTHPVTGARCLFVNPVYTVGVEGVEAEAGAALLADLFAHITSAAFVYRHVWQADMLVMWDNARLLHNATGGYDGHRRVMHRTTVAGERPI
jgi:taurine dioxygenase